MRPLNSTSSSLSQTNLTDSPASSKRQPIVYVWNEDVESLEDYCPGGYHPVHIGDTFSAGRYEVIHKLGHGSYSTVWLCKDIPQQLYVSIKVTVSESDGELRGYEHKVLQALRNGDPRHPGRRFVIHLLDEFAIDGPNGRHQCFVFPVALNSVYMAKQASVSENFLFPPQVARSIATQALLALSYIHSCGIIHGGMVTNILIQAPSSSVLWPLPKPYEEIRNDKKLPVKRYDGAPIESNVPKYQIMATGMYTPSDLAAPDSKIYITDFGEAFFDQPSSGTSLPTQLNTPILVKPFEGMFGYSITSAVDTWTLGLTLFEIFGRHKLFQNSFFPTEDTVLSEAIGTLGPLPSQWWQAWPSRSKFFKDDGSFQEGIVISPDLKEQLRSSLGRETDSAAYGYGESEMTSFGELLKSMLRYEPQDRVTVDEALKSGWVRDYGIPALKESVPDIDLSSLGVPQHVGEKDES